MSLASDIAGSLGRATRLGVVDATLYTVAAGSRTSGSVSAGMNAQETSHSCRGFERTFDAKDIDGTTVTANDRIVNLFASTISTPAEPKPGDKVTIGGSTYRIISVARDPATVLFRCHGRK